MHRLIFSIAAIFYGTILGLAQETTLVDAVKLRKIDSLCQSDLSTGSPGLAAAIVWKGKLVYQKTGGLANLDSGKPIGPRTRFNLASNGKQFTALAVQVLLAQGRLTIDQDIRVFLPTLFTNLTGRITIRHLLTHTSGIRDIYDLWSLQGITWWQHAYSGTDALRLLERQAELNFTPGSAYLYSNSNYVLLAEMVGRASGKGFKAFTDSIFLALGMKHTGFETDHQRIPGDIARPYFNFDTWTTYPWIWDLAGDGNLFSTLEDQLRWELILQGAQATTFPAAILQASQQPIPGTEQQPYGYGLEFGSFKGMPYRFHEGATGAWKATLLRFPEQELAIFINTNSGKVIPSLLGRQVAEILLLEVVSKAQVVKTPVDNGERYALEELEGTYLNPDGFYFQFKKRDTSLYLLRYGRNDTRLVRAGGNLFRQWNDDSFIQAFRRETGGAFSVTAFHPSHDPYTLQKTEANWNGFQPSSLDGIYLNAETGVRIQFRWMDQRRVEWVRGDDTARGELVKPGLLIAGSYRFSWDLTSQGSPKELFLDADRIRRVRFVRMQPRP